MKWKGHVDPAESSTTSGRWPIWLLACWFGLMTGSIELALLVVRVKLFEKGVFLKSSHFPWMVPVADLSLFLGLGLVAALLVKVWPSRGPSLGIGAFVFLAVLGQLLLVRGLMALACVILAAGLARLLTPVLFHRRSAFLKLVRWTTPLLALGLVVIAGWTFAREAVARRRILESRPMAAPGSTNVLLIVLDTVRADHLSLYGYDRPTTPNLSRIAKQGTRFDRVHSTAPWTLPSHASLMTGRWPHELEVERRGGLDATYPTLAEFLGQRGYDTVGVVANRFYCGHESGLSRGFDDYRDYPVNLGEIARSSTVGWLLTRSVNRVGDLLASKLHPGQFVGISDDFSRKDGDEVNREFLDWVDSRGDRPFFGFLNYFDAHGPYLTPPRFHRHFGTSPNSYDDGVLIRDWWKKSQSSHSADDLKLVVDSYDDCLAALDQQIGRLFDELTRRGLLEKTLIVVTADHGEEFGEHGHFTHGFDLYEPETHVPLLILGPTRVPKDRVIHESVSLRDVSATVVDLLGWRAKSPFPGLSLARTWAPSTDPAVPAHEIAISELRPLIEPTMEKSVESQGNSQSTALFDQDFAYIRGRDGREELYDLGRDAAQTHDLSKEPKSEAILDRFREVFKASTAAAGPDS